VGDAGGRKPQVVRPDQRTGGAKNRPHLCIRARRGEMNAFDEGGAPGALLRLQRP
jgi:hypothetical protein